MKTALWMIPAMGMMLAAGAADAGELRATVRNVKPEQGKVWVALYDGADAYKADKRLAGQFVAAAGPEVTVVFTGLPPGRYGLSAFQDLDGDGKLATNLFGVPSEPYGFSRSAAANFGPPAFDELAVPVAADPAATTTIALTP